MAEIDEEMVDVLNSGVAALTKGTNLFMGPKRPKSDTIPGKAVFVLSSGGPAPITFLTGNSISTDLKSVSVQVWVRGASDEGQWDEGQALAKASWEALEQTTLPSAISKGVKAQESAPMYLGMDRGSHPEWSMNFLVYKEE